LRGVSVGVVGGTLGRMVLGGSVAVDVRGGVWMQGKYAPLLGSFLGPGLVLRLSHGG
jgi:hypothetical protein